MPRPRLGVADVVQRIAKSIIGKQVVVLTQLQVQWNCNTIGLHTGIHVCFPRCRFPLVIIQQVTWKTFFSPQKTLPGHLLVTTSGTCLVSTVTVSFFQRIVELETHKTLCLAMTLLNFK